MFRFRMCFGLVLNVYMLCSIILLATKINRPYSAGACLNKHTYVLVCLAKNNNKYKTPLYAWCVFITNAHNTLPLLRYGASFFWHMRMKNPRRLLSHDLHRTQKRCVRCVCLPVKLFCVPKSGAITRHRDHVFLFHKNYQRDEWTNVCRGHRMFSNRTHPIAQSETVERPSHAKAT